MSSLNNQNPLSARPSTEVLGIIDPAADFGIEHRSEQRSERQRERSPFGRTNIRGTVASEKRRISGNGTKRSNFCFVKPTMFNKKILLILLLLVALPSVLAEFSIDIQPETRQSCPTEINLFTIPITNTGSDQSIYTISLSGSAAKWAVAAPPGFVLSPGETQAVFVYVTPSRDVRIGRYSLDISINDGKASRTITEEIIIKECFGATLLVAEAEKTICSCEETDFLFKLTNSGEWVENYILHAAGSASIWATTSEQVVRLQPGESKEILVHIAPGCENIGVYGLTLTADSETSEAVDSANVGLVIKGCYDFNAYLEQNYYSFCENSEIKVPITIENKGTSSDKYKLSVSGPSWISLDKTKLEINGGGGATVNLVAFPAYGVSGKNSAKIAIESDKGSERKEIEVDLNVQTCYSTQLEATKSSDSLCPGTQAEHKIVLTNAGSFDETYSLSISGANWASLDVTTITLNPSESKEVTLTLAPDINTAPKKYEISISAKAQDTSGSKASAKFEAEVLAKNKCLGVELSPEIDSTKIELGGTALIPITIKNSGIQKTKYTLDISGNGASYAQLNPSALEVAGGESDKTYLYISAPDKSIIGEYSLTLSARDEKGVVSSSSEISFEIVDEIVGKDGEDVITPPVNDSEDAKQLDNASTSSDLIDKIPSASGIYTYLKEHIFLTIFLVIVLIIIIGWMISKAGKDDSEDFIDDFYDDEPLEETKTKDEKKGLWKRFTAWMNAEDIEEFEVGWDLDEEKASKKAEKKAAEPKVEEKKKGLWQKFSDWLEEDLDEEPATKSKPKIKPKKEKSKTEEKKGAWQKFTEWINEEGEDGFFEPEPEEEDVFRKKTSAKKKDKKSSEPEKKGLWSKFMAWLEEDEVPSKKKPSTPKKKNGKKKKGAWQKFTDWLEEE